MSAARLYPKLTGDSGRDRRASGIHSGCIALSIAFAFLIIRSVGWRHGDSVLPMAVGELAALGALRLNYVGNWIAAVRLVYFGMLFVSTFLVSTAHDGFRSIAMLLFPGVLLIGVMVPKGVDYLFLAFATLLTVTGLGVAEIHGIIPTVPIVRTTTDYWTVFFVDLILLVIAFVGYLLSRNDRLNLVEVRLLAENISDVIWILDLEVFRFRYISPSVERLLGYKPEEIIARDPLETVTAKSADFLAKILPDRIKDVKRGAQQLYIDEIEQPCRNGSAVWVEVTSHYVANEQTGHLEVYGVSRDISERKRAQQELQLSQQKLRESSQHYLMVAKCIPDAIWSMDLSGRYTYVSPAVERTHGWTVEECLNLSRQDVVTPQQIVKTDILLEDELKKTASPQYDRNRVITLESEQLRKDGTTVWVEINAIFIWSDDGKPIGLTGVTRDITERKRAEAERERLRSQLAQAQKMESIGRLAGGVAHDFNNHLTVINGYCALVLAKLEPGDPLRHQIQEIDKAGKRAAELTRQLLAFSRKQVLNPQVLDLNRIVEGVQSMTARLVGEDVEVCIVLSTKSPFVQADPHQLEQVIMNLVVNARDAMPRGGRLLIETALEVQDESSAKSHPESCPGPFAMLAVSDTGEGMDAATRERIFEPFFTTKKVGEGTGLGLSMVQGIVAQSDGYIDVYSEPGHGTTFRIYLPAVAEPEDADKPATNRDLRGRETILLVEDQENVRNYAISVLKEYGYGVTCAANAEEALTICERHGERIDLLLTDVVMANVSGRELADQVAKRWPQIKVLFMSGYTDDAVTRHGALQKGTEFIQKPFSPSQLADRVRGLLNDTGSAGSHPGRG